MVAITMHVQGESIVDHGLILLGHGSRDPEWARPLREVAARLTSAPAAPCVELAFLEWIEPTLGEACARLAARGVARIAVVPMFIAQSGHVRRDLPAQVDAARARHPGVRIDLAVAVGEDGRVQQAMADAALAALAG
jgi:sirohydrochlorin cobaltochelatase